MPTAEIAALDVQGRTAPDAVLFCWATCPMLPAALEVVRAWGFTYKTHFVWHKPRGAVGSYHKGDVGDLILAPPADPASRTCPRACRKS